MDKDKRGRSKKCYTFSFEPEQLEKIRWDSKIVDRALADKSYDPLGFNEDFETSMHKAIRDNDLDTLYKHLVLSRDVDSKNKAGQTLLDLAIQLGNDGAIEILEALHP